MYQPGFAVYITLGHMTRYLDTLPQPWTRAQLEAALFKSHSDVRLSIAETPGGKLWRALQDLDDSVWIFQASTTELLDEISLFGERSKNPTFWHEAHGSEAETHTRAVKRKVFNCTSALMALVDHARHFQRATPVSGYDERLKADFSTPGLHDFLKSLRNYNVHWRIAQTNWVIEHDLKVHSRETRFRVSKAELLMWDGWTASAKDFIARASDTVDVYDVFSTYRKHVQSFYAWHHGSVLDQFHAVLRPYLDYKRIYEGLLKKYNWNLVLSHVPKTANPFQYLRQYLPQHQVERLLIYDHRSDEQVDALVHKLDMEDFCDPPLREKLLALFRQSPA